MAVLGRPVQTASVNPAALRNACQLRSMVALATFLTTLEDDIELCRHSLQLREPIAITAAVNGRVCIITGVVTAIEPVSALTQVRKITIDEKRADAF